MKKLKKKKNMSCQQPNHKAPFELKWIKGVLHLLPPKAPKLSCFVLYLKIINIF